MPVRVATDDGSLGHHGFVTDLLREAKARYADQGVLIRGDASLNYQDLADVLASCETAGIQNIRLPVRPRDGEPASP